MNYLKYLLLIVTIIVAFLLFNNLGLIKKAEAISCVATSQSSTIITLESAYGNKWLYRKTSDMTWWQEIGIITGGFPWHDEGLASGTTYTYGMRNLPSDSFTGFICSVTTFATLPPPTTGTVRITPNIASASWTLTGPLTNQSGTGSVNLTNKNTGTYNITWNPVAGYTAIGLNPQSLLLTAGGAITFARTYTPVPITAPTLNSPTHTSITTSSAILGANIVSNGGAPITARGTCWGTTSPGTNCAPAGGTALGTFSHLRIGMPSGTAIYYRGYATNSAGTAYSPTASFNTLNTVAIPTLITLIPAEITSSSALLGGAFSSSGGAPITARQVCWGLSAVATTNCINYGPGPSIAEFGGTHTGMPSGTLIYFRAYGTNSAGTGQSAPASFTTLGAPLTTGTINALSCLISAGASSCGSAVSWSITNPVAPNSVRQNGTGFSTASNGATTRTISYGGPNTFTLYSNNGSVLLATASPTALCTVGTSWNGSACAVIPAFSCTGVTPTNATIYAGDETGLSANTPKTYSVTNTAPKCQFSCNAGTSWNGTSCVASSCGDNICNGIETLLTCPRDCKGKVQQF